MTITSLFAEMTPYYSHHVHTTDASDAAAAGLVAVVVLFSFIFAAIVYVATAFLLGRIFKKAGVESWKAWVPVYNNWTLFELGGQKGYWSILLLVPVINIVATVFLYIAHYYIGLKLGKEGTFVLLAIFLPIVWLIWLAVDSSTWKGEKPVSPASMKKVS